MKVRWGLLAILVLFISCGCKTAWPKVSTLDDGSQIYRFENGKSCVKTPYALKNTDVEGALKIREIFETNFSYEKKYERIKSLGKEFDQLDAAFFSICHDHAEGRIDDTRYTQFRDEYERIRQEFLKKELGESFGGPREWTPISGLPAATSDNDVFDAVAGSTTTSCSIAFDRVRCSTKNDAYFGVSCKVTFRPIAGGKPFTKKILLLSGDTRVGGPQVGWSKSLGKTINAPKGMDVAHVEVKFEGDIRVEEGENRTERVRTETRQYLPSEGRQSVDIEFEQVANAVVGLTVTFDRWVEE